MKWVGSLNHNLQHAASERPSESPLLLRDTKHISGWGCVHMTTSHSGRCWNAWYMYDIDLIWVWSGWGASIITYSMLQVRETLLLLLLPQWFISGWGCVLMTTSHSGRCWTHYICMNLTCYHMSMRWLGCLNHNLQHAASTLLLLPQWLWLGVWHQAYQVLRLHPYYSPKLNILTRSTNPSGKLNVFYSTVLM